MKTWDCIEMEPLLGEHIGRWPKIWLKILLDFLVPTSSIPARAVNLKSLAIKNQFYQSGLTSLDSILISVFRCHRKL